MQGPPAPLHALHWAADYLVQAAPGLTRRRSLASSIAAKAATGRSPARGASPHGRFERSSSRTERLTVGKDMSTLRALLLMVA
jgi:hypothetical protein